MRNQKNQRVGSFDSSSLISRISNLCFVQDEERTHEPTAFTFLPKGSIRVLALSNEQLSNLSVVGGRNNFSQAMRCFVVGALKRTAQLYRFILFLVLSIQHFITSYALQWRTLAFQVSGFPWIPSGCIAQGLLQVISLRYGKEVWARHTSFLQVSRTSFRKDGQVVE